MCIFILFLLGASPSISVRRLELYKLMELYMELYGAIYKVVLTIYRKLLETMYF